MRYWHKNNALYNALYLSYLPVVHQWFLQTRSRVLDWTCVRPCTKAPPGFATRCQSSRIGLLSRPTVMNWNYIKDNLHSHNRMISMCNSYRIKWIVYTVSVSYMLIRFISLYMLHWYFICHTWSINGIINSS